MKNTTVQKVAWAYAAVLVVMALAQLFAFEKFIPLLEAYNLPGGHGTATLVACVVVLTEIFALPFLLGMQVSPLMRWVSLVCSVIAPVLWLKLALVAVIGGGMLANGGMLGAKVAVASGLQLGLAVVIVAAAVYVVRGKWPIDRK